MAQVRRVSLLWLALAGVVTTTAMCARDSASRDAAERFMEVYYGQSRLADAVALCSGPAKIRLDGEIANTEGVPADAAADKPHVSFRLVSEGAATAGAAAYVYGVDPRTPGVSPLVATLGLTDEGGRWVVTTIEERQGTS